MSKVSPVPPPSKTPAVPSTTTTCVLLLLRQTHRRNRLLRTLRFCTPAALPLRSSSSPDASHLASYYSTVAPSPPSSPPRSRWDGPLLLTATACAVAISVSCVFFSAIRSILACKRAAESLEKFSDVAREKLPETMAEVRLVGREIRDLTMDLNDLGQEMTKGVRNSLSIVHTAEGQLHQLTTRDRQGPVQRLVNRKKGTEEPLLATSVRNIREVIADGRTAFGMAFSIIHLVRWASKFASNLPKNKKP